MRMNDREDALFAKYHKLGKEIKIEPLRFPQAKTMSFRVDLGWSTIQIHDSCGDYVTQLLLNDKTIDDLIDRLQQMKKGYMKLDKGFEDDYNKMEHEDDEDE